MLLSLHSDVLLSELGSIRDMWNNSDGTMGILFDEPGMKSLLHDRLDMGSFDNRHGFREHLGEIIMYIGFINLIECDAHLYVPQAS